MTKEVVVTISAYDSFSNVFSKYSDAVKRARNDTSDLGNSANTNRTSFDQLTNSIKGLVVAYAGVKGVQLVGEMLELGNAANRTEIVFRQLTSAMGGYEANMSALRAATGGIVDDMTLQAGNNKLVQMGLAETTEEMAKLTEMAVKLGGSMGMDVTKSMSDFSLMLANNSIMRLDQFGISSGRVRAEMARLKEAGEAVDRSEAFKLAVLKEGEEALARLGDAAIAAETPIARLQNTLNNFVQDVSQNVATGVNAIAGIIEIGLGQNPIQIAQRQQIADQSSRILPGVVQGMGAEGDLNFVYQFIERFLTEAQSDPAIAQHAAEVGARIFEQMGGEGAAQKAGLSFSETFDNLVTYKDVFEVMTQSILQVREGLDYTAQSAQGVTKELDIMSALVAGTEAEPGTRSILEPFGLGVKGFSGYADPAAADQAFQDALAQRSARQYAANYYSAYTDYWRENARNPSFMFAYSEAFTVSPAAAQIAANRSAALMQEALEQKMSAANALRGFMDLGGDLSVGDYVTRDRADALAAQYEEAETRFERLQELNAQGLISDEDLTGASDFKDRIKEAADDAERAAAAFENMKLSDVFGQTSGGLLGQMTDDLIKRMKASGASEEQIASVQGTLDMASGRATESSQAYEQNVIPIIEQIAQIDPDMAATALSNLQTFMQQAKLLGMTDEQIASNMAGALGVNPGGAGGSFTVSPYGQGGNLSTVSDVIAYFQRQGTNVSQEQIMAAANITNPRFLQAGTYNLQGYEAAQGFDVMAYINAIMAGGGVYGSGGITGRSGAQAGSISFDQIGFGTGIAGGSDKINGDGVDPLVVMQEGIDVVTEKARGAEDQFAKIRSVIGDANTDMEDLVATLEQIPAFHEMKIKFTAEDPYGIIALVQAINGGSSMAQIVQSNGGAVPGTPAQTSNGTGGGKPY
jgi:hypothetical protein